MSALGSIVRLRWWIVAFVVGAASVGQVGSQEAASDGELAQIIRQLKTISVRDTPPDHPLARTAHAFRRYMDQEISEPELLREVKAAYPDRQVRTSLAGAKTQIIQLLGATEAQYFLGELYSLDSSAEVGTPRNSALEDRVLTWRSDLAERVKVRLAAEFRGRHLGGAPGTAAGPLARSHQLRFFGCRVHTFEHSA